MLVTAGPSREFLDPVRFLSNRSSGKMGYAVARQALARGHAVTLVSGPVALPPPPGADVTQVTSAEDMLGAVRQRLAWCHALVMVAAVADWRPAQRSASKLKKEGMPPVLALERTPDILSCLAPQKGARCFVGFAAETDDFEKHARAKLAAKRLDMIVLNDVGRSDAGFETDTNQVRFLAADGRVSDLPLMSKDDVAARIVQWIEAHAAAGADGPATQSP